ncbi:MAG TPA: transcriptional repressor LexA [Thermoanaerobaculia bacterium]|nr:transcriptional repressor LexA [Thermoanaerobaculia bacterium]
MTPVKDYLTPRQKEILEFIRDFRRANGYSPTHREICERFGFTSYGTVHKHLKLLERKGFLRRDWNQKRGVELVDAKAGAGSLEVSFLGRIAAGEPIEAIRDEETLAVPPQLLRGPEGQHFVLRVVGESMIEEGIHDGDLVVIQRRDTAATGDMVVALIDDEATLKRFYPEGERVRLQPANRAMPALLLPADKVRVQGVAVGLMRRF